MKVTHMDDDVSKAEGSNSARERVSDFTKLKDNDTNSDANFTQLRERPSQISETPEDNAGATASDSQTTMPCQSMSTWQSLLILALVFVASLGAVVLVYLSFPDLEENEKQYVKLPRDIEDAKNLGRLLSRYKEKYHIQVFLGFFIAYIFLQTFAIPGSIFLSIISGFLYPFFVALPLVCLCSAVGATNCYLLSLMVGTKIVQKYMPERAARWKGHVDKHRENLFNYILFLRITPFLPNWFINITSPVIDVPLSVFFLGTLFGVAPPSFVFVQAGTTLHTLTKTTDAWSLTNVGLLALFSVVAILPVAFKGKLRSKLE